MPEAKKSVKTKAGPRKAKIAQPSTRKKVGRVSAEERDEIQSIFERRNGLNELFRTLMSTKGPLNESLYNQLVSDTGKTSTSFDKWWDSMNKKYGWESLPNHRWEIDFDTCEIYIVEQ